jgi:hypothetical protein
MPRTTRWFVALTLACLSIVGTAAAATQGGRPVPHLVKFTGVVTGVQGTVGVTFAFYADQASEAPLWAETQQVVVDETGRYAVHLGASRPEGLPLDVFAMGEAHWLGVRVEGAAEQPRVLLVSVPYALKAADADTIRGKPLSAFVLAGEKTGIGTDGLTYVDARTLSSGLATTGSAAPGGAGSANYIGLFTDATTLGNSVIYQTPAGSIGVNTLAPNAAFHLMAPTAPAAYFDVYNNALGALPVVYRAARGTPSAPAAVQTNDILGGLAVRGYGTSTFSAGRGQVMFKAAENWTDEANGTYLQFTTTPLGSGAWAERIRVTPDGNVGIGTPTPAEKLSVTGTIESSAGGFKYPDGTTQTTAGKSYTAGTGLSLASDAFSVTFGGTGAGTTVARSDHHHDASYVSLSAMYYNPVWLAAVAASKVTGSLPVAQISGAATLGANTFVATQTIGGGNLALPATTSASSGVLTLGGQPFLHGYGGTNTSTFVGYQAGSFSASGSGSNTGVGTQALGSNTSGYRNTAIGYQALVTNTTGINNTASGYLALTGNTTGRFNTASGYLALATNTDGYWNTADGHEALENNTSGYENTACGASALYFNTTGFENTATGLLALYSNGTGVRNTASGHNAMYSNTTGSSNIAIGASAGSNLTTGSNNIDIGHPGVATEGSTTRIGTAGTQTRAFVAGIRGVTTGSANAIAVLIDSAGQLGTVSSSRRVKDDIADMNAASGGLMKLRPVTFHYKGDQNPAGRTLQYGLIAEEVAEVYPGLVAHSADGQIETVMYQFLPSMLLNEAQKQQRTIDALRAQVEAGNAQARSRDDQIRTLAEQVEALTQAVAALRGERK